MPTRDWPDPSCFVGEAVDITLKYAGNVPSEQQKGGQSEIKHIIRKEFSKQLRVLWNRERQLLQFYSAGLPEATYQANRRCHPPKDNPFFRVQTCGFSAIPLVSWHNRLGCELIITFIGQGMKLLNTGGDLDNRVKTLFDALRMPRANNEVPASMFGDGGDLYCLLEDDSLIRKFCVEVRESYYSPPREEVEVRAHIVTQNEFHPLLADFR